MTWIPPWLRSQGGIGDDQFQTDSEVGVSKFRPAFVNSGIEVLKSTVKKITTSGVGVSKFRSVKFSLRSRDQRVPEYPDVGFPTGLNRVSEYPKIKYPGTSNTHWYLLWSQNGVMAQCFNYFCSQISSRLPQSRVSMVPVFWLTPVLEFEIVINTYQTTNFNWHWADHRNLEWLHSRGWDDFKITPTLA